MTPWTVDAGYMGSIPGLGRSPGGGYGNPLKYCYLGNFMDRGAGWATVRGVAKESDMTANKQQQQEVKSDRYHRDCSAER